MEYGQAFADLAAAVRDTLPDDAISGDWLERAADFAVTFEKNRAKMADEYMQSDPLFAKHCLERLSKQEYTVLEFLCAGLSTQDMAERMGVQQATIHTYLHRVYKKSALPGGRKPFRLRTGKVFGRRDMRAQEPDAEKTVKTSHFGHRKRNAVYER
ncbi:MAG: LuxR C-terminal-related transcriptional regulator [Clostridiales bacterium]|nr:LuxR C-terminal-related transcriptional regulator [Clostridiales bacterium]